MLTELIAMDAQENFGALAKALVVIAAAGVIAVLLSLGYPLLCRWSRSTTDTAWEVENRADETYEIPRPEAAGGFFGEPIAEVFADLVCPPPKAFGPRQAQARFDKLGNTMIGVRVIGYIGYRATDDCPAADFVVWMPVEVVASLENTIRQYALRYDLNHAIQTEVDRQNAAAELAGVAQHLSLNRINGVEVDAT